MNHPDQTSAPSLLDAAEAVVRQIESLTGESSVIDEAYFRSILIYAI